jgi:hypothetical protein
MPTKTVGENSLLLRFSEWQATNDSDMHTQLILEFVMHFKNNETDLIEMSCGFCSIDVSQLRYNKTVDLQLFGGTPLRVTEIQSTDVRTNRTGWRFIVKKLGRSITSKLTIDVKTLDKLPKDVVVN